MKYLFLHTFDGKAKQFFKTYNLDHLRQHIALHLGATTARLPEARFQCPVLDTPTQERGLAQLRYTLPDGRLGHLSVTIYGAPGPLHRREEQHKVCGILADAARKAIRAQRLAAANAPRPILVPMLTLDYGEPEIETTTADAACYTSHWWTRERGEGYVVLRDWEPDPDTERWAVTACYSSGGVYYAAEVYARDSREARQRLANHLFSKGIKAQLTFEAVLADVEHEIAVPA